MNLVKEIRVDFNQRGDPIYRNADLYVNQYSKNVDKLSFSFEQDENITGVYFAAKRNDDEESIRIECRHNLETNRYEYIFGDGEDDNGSLSSWFTFVAGKLLITVYVNNNKAMKTFTIFVNPSVSGFSENISIPETLVADMMSQISKKVDKVNGTASNLTINGGQLNNVNVDTPTSQNHAVNKQYVDNIKSFRTTETIPNDSDWKKGDFVFLKDEESDDIYKIVENMGNHETRTINVQTSANAVKDLRPIDEISLAELLNN